MPKCLSCTQVSFIAGTLLGLTTLGHADNIAVAADLDSKELATLQTRAKIANSDAVVVFHKGEVVAEWYFGKQRRKIESMSVTKSIVNLVVGALVTQGKIDSIDTPVSKYFPQWNQGKKRDITIRHLLDHTSGLQNVMRADLEIYPSPNIVELALAAEVTHDPGTHWGYNNKAVNLLAGIVDKASGKPMDVVFRESLATPLGITDFEWSKDKAGNPYAMAGLQIHAMDLAKLGVMTLNRGTWERERQIIDSWFDMSLVAATEHQGNCGLLWWLIPSETTYIIDDDKLSEFRRASVDADFINKISTIRGSYDGGPTYDAALKRALGPGYQRKLNAALGPHGLRLSRKRHGKIIGYRADGYLGQYIVILPKSRIVAVRMIANSDWYNQATDSLGDFSDLVRKLVPED